MVFQKPNPFPAMSIADNVTAGLKLTNVKISRGDVASWWRAAFGEPGCGRRSRTGSAGPAATCPVANNSGSASPAPLRSDPEVLLMDEPCSALDPTSTRWIEETIAELRSEVTVVIVTHNMQQAVRVSQYAAFFLAEQGTPGRIVEQGPTEQLFDNPHDPRTADYVNGRFG